MNPIYLEVRGGPEIIKNARELVIAAGERAGEPKLINGVTEGLDAPINGQEVKELLELVLLAFNTLAAGIAAAKAIRDLLKSSSVAQSLQVFNPKRTTKKPILVITANTSDAEIEKGLGS